jgi:lauroyl/myristoyl acyltransferase
MAHAMVYVPSLLAPRGKRQIGILTKKLMYYLLRTAIIVLPWIPNIVRAYLALAIGTIAWCVAGPARKQANKNIRHVFGEEYVKTPQGRRKLRKTVRQMFQHNVRNYIEVCVLSRHTEAKHKRMAKEYGFEHLDAGLALGKGLIVFTAHYGPFDFIIQSGSYHHFDVTAPVEPLKDQRLLDLMLKLRGSQGIHFVPLGSTNTMRTILRALKENNIVVLTADRGSQGQKSSVPFFDAPADLPNGAVTLAQRTGAALVGAFAVRSSLTHIELHCVPLTADMTEEQKKDTAYVSRKVSETMEQFIRKHPEQWLAFSPIWPE